MTTTSVASVRKFFQTYFPERHLYHRSRGSVQFVVLTAPAQIALLALSLGFFGWVAYSSVNVVFKDEIIAAKEKHFTTMQAAYENRIAEMQTSLDEIHTALVNTQDRFSTAAGELEGRHKALTEILNRHEAAIKGIGALKNRVTQVYKQIDTTSEGNRLVMSGEDSEPQLRASRQEPDGQGGGSTPLSDKADPAMLTDAQVIKDLPKPLAQQSKGIASRFGTLDQAQHSMIAQLDTMSRQSNRSLERILAVTGLSANSVVERVAEDEADVSGNSTEGQGGPYAPIAALNIFAKRPSVAALDPALATLKETVDRLFRLETALTVIPLVGPLTVDYHLSSPFGRRIDPMTGQAAFHYGLDFVAPLTSPVLATSPGVVTIAGRQGPYGNLVEIDHGHGLRTRYGHLYRIDVKVGDVVKFHQRVGLLGSTGRSTGPHVHYEVRFNGTLRDPARFLEAGRYVYQG